MEPGTAQRVAAFSRPVHGAGRCALVQSRAILRTRFIHPSTDFDDLANQLCAIDPLHLYAYPEFLVEDLNVSERNGANFRRSKKSLPGLRSWKIWFVSTCETCSGSKSPMATAPPKVSSDGNARPGVITSTPNT